MNNIKNKIDEEEIKILNKFRINWGKLLDFEKNMLRIYAILNILNEPASYFSYFFKYVETYKDTYLLKELKQILLKLYEERSEIYKFQRSILDFNVSYSVPNWDLICQIVTFLEKNNCQQVIEIGSGVGLWAALIRLLCKLKKNNIKFIATDYEVQRIVYTEILGRYADKAIENYKNSDCLFLCWPPAQHMKDAYKHQYSAGKMIQQFKGNYLIYIGMPKEKELEEMKKLEKVEMVFTGDDLFLKKLRIGK